MNTKIKAAMAIAASVASAHSYTVNTSLWFNGDDQTIQTIAKNPIADDGSIPGSFWYDFDDRKYDNGGSSVSYPYDTTGYYGSLIAPEIDSLGYVAVAYKLVDPTTTGQTAEFPYNFVGLAFNLVDGEQTPLDITAAGGLCSVYTSDIAVTLEVTDPMSGDASCNITLPRATVPTMVSKVIADFSQPSWTTSSQKLSSCADAFANATAVKFKLDGCASNHQGFLRIFRVGPAGTCGEKLTVHTKEPDFAYKSDGEGHASYVGLSCGFCFYAYGKSIDYDDVPNGAASASETIAKGNLWFYGADQQVETPACKEYFSIDGEDCGAGYWYDYDDRKNDNGGSYALYPYDTTGFYGSLIQPEIENLGYAAIAYHLVNPKTTGQTADYPYNFVGLGFDLARGGEDITSAGGICVTYTSDNAVTLQVADSASGNASCEVTLPKATTPTVASKTIAEFTQPTWATEAQQLASCADAFAAATAVKFKLDGGAAESMGLLRIFEVGDAGACTGNVSISANEPSFCYKSDGNGHATLSEECFVRTDAIRPAKTASSVKATYANHVLSISGLRDAAAYSIVSLQGQVVKSGVATSSVDLSSLHAGVYMMRIQGKSLNMNQMILVK